MADLAFLDTASPTFSTRGAETLAARGAHWCARTPYGLAILRHREAGILLRDRRLRQGSYAWPARNDLTGAFARFWSSSVISQEGDRHRRLRRIAGEALTADFIASLEPAWTQAADQLADDLPAHEPADFMEAFATPFAGMAIAILLGMDTSDWARIGPDATALGLAMGVDCKAHEPAFNAACERLMTLADERIGMARKGEDRSGYVARLLHYAEVAGPLDEAELRNLVVISIFGGVDTTRAQLGIGMGLFADRPEQWAALRADQNLIPQAVEEFIRAQPTTTWVTREALEDFDFQDMPIRAGETLHILVHATARDPAICDDPAFSILAKRRAHFGFGGGAHHCMGAAVARADIACALGALTERIETLRPAGPADWLPDSGNTGPVRLPLHFGRA